MTTSNDQSRCVDYDAELRRHNEVLRRACGVRPHERVLDIGCGTGQTTRDAGRIAVRGSAMGVDVSAPMIRRARELTEAEGIRNVTFEHTDAALHRFLPEHFDVVISRFGTMFFAEPAAAFANIARALRPGGRLVMMVWQACDRNEWFLSIRQSLAESTPVIAPEAPDPFSLADPAAVDRILDATGFTRATFTDVHEPVYYGADVSAALEWVRGFSFTKDIMQQLDPASRERALQRLHEALAAHDTGKGVWFDSRAWIVTASRR